MGKFILSVIMGLLFIGCAVNETFDWQLPPLFGENAEYEKAYAEFLQRPIVKEFQADGMPVDCEKSICSQISEASLEILRTYKAQFLQKDDRIKYITLVKEDYPIFDYRIEGAYIPAQLSESLLVEFFDVLNMIRSFEAEVGFRIEFPNNRHLKFSVSPLLQILKDNKASLKAEAHRLDLLVVSSVYNQFYPGKKVLMLKIDDLRKSFADLWAFMSLFYKSQDLFGDVSFDFDKGDNFSTTTMETLFQNSATFQPLLAKLQGRRIALFPMDFYGYSDRRKLMDMGVSSSHDEKYLEAVFRDQIWINELSSFIGIWVSHLYSLIDLQDHDECLEKIESIKSNIKGKASFLKSLVVASGELAPADGSSFAEGKLFLNCNQTASDMEAVVKGIH